MSKIYGGQGGQGGMPEGFPQGGFPQGGFGGDEGGMPNFNTETPQGGNSGASSGGPKIEEVD